MIYYNYNFDIYIIIIIWTIKVYTVHDNYEVYT